MNFFELLGIIMIALVVVLIFTMIFKVRGPWGSFWTLFIVVLLSVWAADLWLIPAGPVIWDLAWILLIFVAIVVALLLAAAESGVKKPKSTANQENEVTSKEMDTASKISAIFWVILLFLILAIVIGLFL
ncbi:MAG: hypothetical protein ACOCXH_10700 [Cyclobacteriaceae bacterium]